jgi:AcrR family transcriptional regulator
VKICVICGFLYLYYLWFQAGKGGLIMKESGKRGQNKRDIILEAAVQVFASKGYHNARMEEIATVAGIGKGTIYEYFNSKLQLFQEMLESSLDVYYNHLDANRKGQISFEERMSLVFKAHVTFCREQKDLTRILFWDTEIIDEELKDWFNQIRKKKEERVTELVEEGIARGELRAVDSRLLTNIIIGSLGSVWVPITLENWEVDPDVLAAEMIDMLMYGVKAKDNCKS